MIMETSTNRHIASLMGVSSSAVLRHMQHHVPATYIASARASRAADLTPNLFADRLSEIAQSALEVRTRARQTNDGDLELKAGLAETKSLQVLMTCMGVDSSHTVESLRAGQALVEALRRILPRHPDAANALTEELNAVGQRDLADACSLLASARPPREIAS